MPYRARVSYYLHIHIRRSLTIDEADWDLKAIARSGFDHHHIGVVQTEWCSSYPILDTLQPFFIERITPIQGFVCTRREQKREIIVRWWWLDVVIADTGDSSHCIVYDGDGGGGGCICAIHITRPDPHTTIQHRRSIAAVTRTTRIVTYTTSYIYTCNTYEL